MLQPAQQRWIDLPDYQTKNSSFGNIAIMNYDEKNIQKQVNKYG